MKYSIEHIASIIRGSFLQFHPNHGVEHLLLDSRRLVFPDSSLFFSLRGPRRSGQEFIDDLYHRGVRNFVVYEQVSCDTYPDANIILVRDALQALQELAAFHRRQFELPVIGITGSNGKTIVKEWLNQLLEQDYRIVRSPKSYNSQVGVPLSIWQINETHELGIFEAGISQPGEMQQLAKVICPTIGILTNIGEAHNEGFENNTQKLKEKLGLFDESRAIIYCADQAELISFLPDRGSPYNPGFPLAPGAGVSLFSWGKSERATVFLRSVEKAERQTCIRGKYGKIDFSYTIPFTDDASVENSMHCVCLLLYLGQQPETLPAKLARLLPLAMRLELKSGINNCSVINDSYSADLSSLKIALDFLSQQQQHARRTVILSDILQTGKKEEVLYRELTLLLQEKKLDRLIAIGDRMVANRKMIEQLEVEEILFFGSTESFLKDFQRIQFKNETILLKGARIFQFEQIDRLISSQAHQTVLEISLNAMAHNLKQYQGLLHPATRLMAMVKAFAYGSGSYEIANLLQFHKVDYLAVAYADEGVDLRKAGIRLPIMVMSPEDESFDALIQYNLEPVLYSFRVLEGLEKVLKKQGIRQMPVHIELETGMNRLGFTTIEIPALITAIKNSSCKVQSVFSHLAASQDEQHDLFTAKQASLFLEGAGALSRALDYPFLKHIANSAAIIRHPQWQLDMVRLGIGLYGIDSGATGQLDLQDVSALRSTIAQIRQLQQGDTVGYDRQGSIAADARIATVRIGYADGYSRSLGNGAGKMWLKGRLVPTIGSICMDMTMVDITAVPDVKENDEIIIFGKELSVVQLAHWAGTIPYEILTGISQRVKRIHFEE